MAFSTVLITSLALLSLCHELRQGAAMSLPALGRVRRQVESNGQPETGGDEETAIDRLSELKAGVMVLEQETSILPLPAHMRTINELFAFERSVHSVCVLLEFASTLEEPAAANKSEGLDGLRNILTAIRKNSCTWMTEAYSELQGGGFDCSLEKMEVLCAKKRLQSLAIEVSQDLKRYRRTSIPINVAKWKETYLHHPRQ